MKLQLGYALLPLHRFLPFTQNFLHQASFAPGDIEFTITIQGVHDQVVYILTTLFCNDYTVTVNEDNPLVGHLGKRL